MQLHAPQTRAFTSNSLTLNRVSAQSLVPALPPTRESAESVQDGVCLTGAPERVAQPEPLVPARRPSEFLRDVAFTLSANTIFAGNAGLLGGAGGVVLGSAGRRVGDFMKERGFIGEVDKPKSGVEATTQVVAGGSKVVISEGAASGTLLMSTPSAFSF